jgi:putative Mg2+ transporter-C (MgtC) family protein
MSLVSQAEIEILFNLILAAILGAAIGMERELSHHPAGLRTNLLVCVGAVMYGMMATYGFQSPDSAARIIANILVGVGFLGTGVVMKDEHTVHGLTTAATIWVVAAVGASIAVHLYFLAIAGTVVVLVTLFFLRRFERKDPPRMDAP